MTDANTTIEIREILDRLPHRYPFLLVDRAEDYREGESIVGYKNVTANEPFFPGHFPGNPVMPGVLIVEAVAQAGALLMSKTLDADVSKTAIYFMGVDKVRFRRPVKPGDVLRMPVRVTHIRGDLFKFSGQAFVGDQRVTEFDFSAKGVGVV
ncbi:3-hydroxyacyl-ACP dehydratase FabZ [Hyphobacterium sp. CCMP332]|uniref:3-hydroxyacyl-ACP dehydratase FabZ n=1 Tax=Hyphobacterium sp. CCMP332 TaxID=2749086 RepID=UPI00164FA11B|nr:3-hydroxyacyl-ACP dehydratase FabZ [Hyphobacterium sp. CCMP332]QNL18669.1 3-hydroxyacyl-ACP dehydratase FabZ [Hyphobacterium sp. CCMP332]